MRVEYAPIVEDGSLNGLVCHQTISAVPESLQWSISTSSAGRGHPKHGGDVCSGAAGQDVYGHTSSSIYVADGHGKDGLAAARDAATVVPVLEQMVRPIDLLLRPEKLADRLRSALVDHMQRSTHMTSGATFVQMILVAFKGRRWAVTINIGDSEALLVYQNKVHVCSSAHVWDDRTMYQRYVTHSRIRKPVCYNRWNASDYHLRDPDGGHRPMMLYDVCDGRVTVNKANAEWVSDLWRRRNRPQIRFGTQSVRMHAEPHENWGSCVLVGGRARGQVMATYGDVMEREQTGVPFELVHVYVHEVPAAKDVIAVVQSDGVSNSRTLEICGKLVRYQRDANKYVQSIEAPRDDLSVGMAYFSIVE